jgi:hypothetical protein
VKQTGWKPNPHTYRKAVGTSEVVCGAVLAFVPGNNSARLFKINLYAKGAVVCTVV